MQGFFQFFKNGRFKQMKKSDWAVIALAGVLILIIALPTGTGSKKNKAAPSLTGQNTEEETKNSGTKGTKESDSYVSGLEKKLEEVLEKMDGVGKVTVMITVSDKGESVVEKDKSGTTTTTSETDSGGGSRTVTENGTDQKTVYVETGEETYPYVQKEKLPSIEGVVVVAEGGGNPTVVSGIADAVKALFPVEAHRIKVMKMAKTE